MSSWIMCPLTCEHTDHLIFIFILFFAIICKTATFVFVNLIHKCDVIFTYIWKVFENGMHTFIYYVLQSQLQLHAEFTCSYSGRSQLMMFLILLTPFLHFYLFIFMFTNPYWAGYHAFSVWKILDNHFLNNCWRKPKQQDVINTFVCISIS